jgi:hypothetical protein
MKNSQKGSVNIWLVVIIIVLIVALGYFAFIKNPTTIYPQTTDKSTEQSTEIPLVEITSPNGGEIWRIGSTYTISFAMTGDLGTKTLRLNRYSDDGVRVGATTIGTTESNTFKFTVPENTVTTNGNAGRYKIQVAVEKYSEGRGVADESDNYFSIFPR